MKVRSPIARKSSPPPSKKPPRRRNPKNHKRDFVKRFHSEERIEFVRSLPCLVADDCFGNIENHHITTRGAGGDYKRIVPVCFRHHWQLHLDGQKSFALAHNLDLEKAAVETESAWLAYIGGQPGTDA